MLTFFFFRILLGFVDFFDKFHFLSNYVCNPKKYDFNMHFWSYSTRLYFTSLLQLYAYIIKLILNGYFQISNPFIKDLMSELFEPKSGENLEKNAFCATFNDLKLQKIRIFDRAVLIIEFEEYLLNKISKPSVTCDIPITIF